MERLERSETDRDRTDLGVLAPDKLAHVRHRHSWHLTEVWTARRVTYDHVLYELGTSRTACRPYLNTIVHSSFSGIHVASYSYFGVRVLFITKQITRLPILNLSSETQKKLWNSYAIFRIVSLPMTSYISSSWHSSTSHDYTVFQK